MPDNMSKETRKAVASAGGHGRAAALTPDRRAAVARSGAQATNSPVALARRIVKAWPDLDQTDQDAVWSVLDQIRPPATRPDLG